MNDPKKASILFVDDEENILRGLGRMLRGQRNAWDMRFAQSGAQALEMLAQQPADVIVSDMRMPGMNGAELLTTVQKAYPRTIRIVLSGFAEREAVLKTIGPSHRYLAKPVSEDVLVTSINNALQLRSHLHKESVQRTVTGLSHLPTLPDIYGRILAELNSELGSADRLTSIIEKDVAISAQLMRLTNSAYFSLPQKCSTVKQSINILGFDNVRAAVLLTGVFQQFSKISPKMKDTVERLMERSLAMGVIAQAIARHEGCSAETADQAFCAGLLAHIGTLLLIAHDAAAFSAGMDRVEAGEAGLIEVEEQAFGASHAELGAYLLGLWGFSDAVVEAVAFHHKPSSYTSRNIDVLTAVHAAQFLARELGAHAQRKGTDGGLDTGYAKSSGIEPRIQGWREISKTISKGWPS